MPAWLGVRGPLRALHGTQAETTFSQRSRPPRDNDAELDDRIVTMPSGKGFRSAAVLPPAASQRLPPYTHRCTEVDLHYRSGLLPREQLGQSSWAIISRAAHLRKVRRERTWAVVDADLVPTAGMLQGTPGVDHGRLSGAVRDAVGDDRSVLADTTALADRLFGSHLPANVMLLGIASQLGALPVTPAAIEHAIETQGPAAASNIEAFRWGRWLVADRPAVETAVGRPVGAAAVGNDGTPDQSSLWDPPPSALVTAEALVAARTLPDELRPLLVRRAAQVVDYQSRKLAERWLDLVARAAAVDDIEHGWALTRAVAEGWFKVLTYKDEYEVARLHLRLDLHDAARAAGIEGGYRVQYRLHPPTLRRLGRSSKVALPSGVARPAFRVLAAMRRLRGTPLDVFGLDRHRREERQLAADYGELVAGALDALTPASYDDTVALAESIQSVRGYEDIKSAAIAHWREAVGLS